MGSLLVTDLRLALARVEVLPYLDRILTQVYPS
jgi:hypothetical protein